MQNLNQQVVMYRLDTLVCFDAHGSDALGFLQSQLTQDIRQASATQATLAGYCTAQGRLLATMVLTGTPDSDRYRVIIARDLQETLLKRLRMFVLRSKVTLELATNQTVFGVVVPEAHASQMVAALGHPLPSTPWESLTTASGTWIAAPTAKPDGLRYWWVADPEYAQATLANKLGDVYRFESAEQGWQVQDIQAQLAWINGSNQDLFIPQTINLDLIGGVSFTKGCYPGQEVVARAHYRGTVKRRMHVAKITNEPGLLISPASDIFHSTESENPCGRVINQASEAEQTWLLFEVPDKQIETLGSSGSLHVGRSDGPALSLVASAPIGQG
jgi:folate-binding protein YgfZ